MRHNGIDAHAALRAFAELTFERGPSRRELQAALGLSSVSLTHARLMRMQAEGWIERVHHRGARPHYRLTQKGRDELARINADATE